MTTKERYSYPSVIQYRLVDTGEIVDYPPLNNVKYTLVIHDVEQYNELFKSGALTDPHHTGREQTSLIDNRSTPQ